MTPATASTSLMCSFCRDAQVRLNFAMDQVSLFDPVSEERLQHRVSCYCPAEPTIAANCFVASTALMSGWLQVLRQHIIDLPQHIGRE